MNKRPLADLATKLTALTTDGLTQFLTALTKGDFDTAAKVGGGLKRAQLVDLHRADEGVKTLGVLTQRAIYLHVQQAKLILSEALPVAAGVIKGLMLVPSNLHDAMKGIDDDDLALPGVSFSKGKGDSGEDEIDDTYKATLEAAKLCIPSEKIMDQQRQAALAVFQVAKDWRVSDLSDAYTEEDEETALQRMAKEQGIDLPGHDKPERLLHSVPFAS